MINETLLKQIKRHEGFRQFPYRCTEKKLTIGYGRNLDDKGITREEAENLLINDLAHTQYKLELILPWMMEIAEARRNALVNMAFNMGVYGLLTFRRMLAAMQTCQYDKAADEALNSKWARQVGGRSQELAEQIRTGAYG